MKRLFKAGVVGVLLALGFVLVGCPNGNDPSGPPTYPWVDAETPAITTQPVGRVEAVLVDDSTLVLSVTAAPVGDGGSLQYRWFRAPSATAAGVLVPGAVAATFAPDTDIYSVGVAYYFVEVANHNPGVTGSPWVAVNSDRVRVEVIRGLAYPTVDAQPEGNENVAMGSTYELSVEAAVLGGGTLSFQWYRATGPNVAGVAIQDATETTVSVDTAVLGASYYYVVITNTIELDATETSYTESARARIVVVEALQAPIIIRQPVNRYGGSAGELSVEAVVYGGATLSYQWFTAVDATVAGTLVSGATSAEFTPTFTGDGYSDYFYVVVTATFGGETENVASERARVWIGYVERIHLENGAYAIFRFDLPAGATWADFNSLTADFMVDEDNIERNARHVRLMGAFTEANLVTTVTEGIRWGNLDAGLNAPFIMDDNSGARQLSAMEPNRMFTLTYDITGASAHGGFVDANMPAGAATGPFLFGIGFAGDGTGANGITQYVRNVTLHHATDPALNVISTGSGFDEPTFLAFPPGGSVFSTREVLD